ncbi:LPO_1073/Vpar_1526 family protein [Stenotrophomonas lacuserhaii]|uniref:LPO_1073/Vpar_1526 family protein n=1 Tax=Stenotrophomonas lacuserhaii TaxID=2760084 RepID=UPI001CD85752|nr:LPO_1073/Vpar_1526 family protein [Stenotrophomonas pennii]
MSHKQSQSVAEAGTALQAGGDITVYSGVSYGEVKEIALDVFKANFYQLAGPAREEAGRRATEITEGFLDKLRAENPAGFGGADDPGFQYALYSVQREYARSGDKDLGDLLVDLLVDRSKQEQRDILQLVLDESLVTAPKLTRGQFDVLALIFVFKNTRNAGVLSLDTLDTYLDKYIQSFISEKPATDASMQHLQFTGCGASSLSVYSLEHCLMRSYKGLFMKGFTAQDLVNRGIELPVTHPIFVKCFNDSSLGQINAIDDDHLARTLGELSVSNDQGELIKKLYGENVMDEAGIRSMVVGRRSYMDDLFTHWSSSGMSRFTLTSVGMAIGHANMKRLIGDFSDLSIWIN